MFVFFRIRLPPRSTRTATLFPYTSLFRSPHRRGEAVDRVVADLHGFLGIAEGDRRQHRAEDLLLRDGHVVLHAVEDGRLDVVAAALGENALAAERHLCARTEERGGGKECVSTCRSRWLPSP